MIQYAQLPLDEVTYEALPRWLCRTLSNLLSWPLDDTPWRGDAWVTIAVKGQRIVGIHVYRTRGVTLNSYVTWVSPRMRKRRLGLRLWKRSLQLRQSRRVEVVTCSPSGRGLVQRLQRQFPKVRFRVCHN